MNAASGRSARQPGRLGQGREDERHDAGGRDGDAKRMTLHGEPPLDVMTRAASYGDGVGGSHPGCGPSDTSATALHAAAADGCKFQPRPRRFCPVPWRYIRGGLSKNLASSDRHGPGVCVGVVDVVDAAGPAVDVDEGADGDAVAAVRLVRDLDLHTAEA
jgi:hypothetical protein